MSLRDRISATLGGDAALTIGAGLSALWLAMAGLFWLLGPDGATPATGLMRLATALAVLGPIVLIWLAVATASAITALRGEAADLRLRLGQMREAAARQTSGIAPAPPRAADATRPADAPRPAAQPATTSRVAPRGTDAPETAQATMRFDAPASVAVDANDLIRALNFPSGPDDHDTIAALRAALRDHDHSRVIRAAQDVVTIMAENGLYMDSLQPGPAQPALWRRFAEGMRGDSVQAMGTIDDPAALDLIQAMLKGDEVFRDGAHHFLRHFDLMLTRIGGGLDDDQLAWLADTRSGRAFMLLGRAANVFG